MVVLNFIQKKILVPYYKAFTGLSVEVWWLAFITLINRAGTMVIPFLSLYLTKNLHFTLENVGWIMSAFSLGSLAGSWLGGKLTDRIGYYKVMVYSLFLTGFLFIGLQYLTTLYAFCFGIFIVMLVADMFRPAMFVALNAYSKPENKTRSLTLIRLAINLGFSAGPAVGGLIITSLNYGGLFWVDGITCLLATFVLLKTLNPKRAKVLDSYKNESPDSAYKDNFYLIFLVAMVLFGIVFLQYFSTVPIYYDNEKDMTEFEIGLLLGFNGLVIFIFEMPLIKWLENTKYTHIGLMIFGALMLAASFLVLNLSPWFGMLIFGLLLMSIGEMIVFPFSNAFALARAKKGNQGEYMALYSISFSVAHIIGHNAGLQLIDHLRFENTWYVMVLLSGICIMLLLFLKRQMNTKSIQKSANR